MFSGRVRQAQTIDITRVKGVLVFLLWCASFLAGRSLPMGWDLGAGGLDGLDTPSTPYKASPGAWTTRPGGAPGPSGVPKCAVFSIDSQTLLGVGAPLVMQSSQHLPFMYCEHLLEACSWEHPCTSLLPGRSWMQFRVGKYAILTLLSQARALLCPSSSDAQQHSC